MLWELVRATDVLDLNSSYCYLMISQYFRETSIVAEKQGIVVGFISAFLCPDDPKKLFVWQVAVDGSVRRRGIGLGMLKALFEQRACKDVRYIETTISPDNIASERMFRHFAAEWGATVEVKEGFSANHFPDSTHEDERLFLIGPRPT